MKNFRIISVLSVITAIFAAVAAAAGIFYTSGGESYFYESIRGQQIEIYGRGLYQHMSSEVAVQGIAHDYVILFIAVPVLLISTFYLKKPGLKKILFHAGLVKFFFITYLFYMNMGMYNGLFIVYVILTSTSFFALALTLLNINPDTLKAGFEPGLPRKFIGGFLIFLSSAIALLWLQIIVAPLIDGSIIPASVEHYTSLTVQGLDLSILLPLSFVGGYLFIKDRKWGYFISAVTLVFLCFLMSALVAKIIAMALIGVNVIPVVFIMPPALILAVVCSIIFFKKIKPEAQKSTFYSSSSIHTGA
ncbi:hypothetical protein OQ279_06400 [Salinimicrobium sp. MT39]|uniref:Uncharacterized protein n=1 Tax=Salinimicrobium profundisediminis TaxID=2994553 RepID=A0A9X3CVZ6_9FLAO|nr:hypothetical protein [Salinimicrobium profundisediminis]MCX2837781.1 hypothetical protein [Salinimicrobium profundisediminis]